MVVKHQAYVFLILMVFSREGFVSKIFNSEVTFSEVNSMARVVVIVKQQPLESILKSYKVVEKGKSYPDFNFRVNKFEVVEVLRGEDVKANDVIEVYPPDFDRLLKNHSRYVINKMSISSSFDFYSPQAFNKDDDLYILFLTFTKDNHLVYFCADSFDGLSLKSIVSPSFGD